MRGDSPYYYARFKHIDEDGYLQFSTKKKTKAEAEEFVLGKYQRNQIKLLYGIKKSRNMVDDAAELWLEQQMHKASDYTSIYKKHIQPIVGDENVSRITAGTITNLRHSLSCGTAEQRLSMSFCVAF